MVKYENNFGLNFALGNTAFLGFPSIIEHKSNSWFQYDFIKLDFFEKNKLSIIDTSIWNDFVIYLVNNLNNNSNELYFYGIDRYNFLYENETFINIPEKISFQKPEMRT